jgi:hypothetical protein
LDVRNIRRGVSIDTFHNDYRPRNAQKFQLESELLVNGVENGVVFRDPRAAPDGVVCYGLSEVGREARKSGLSFVKGSSGKL